MCIIIFVLGLIIGSFINVCIFRITKSESICYPTSTCPGCGKIIKSCNLISVVSHIILGRKCASCKKRISLQYPITELLTAVLFLFIYLRFGNSYEVIKNIVLVIFMEIIAIIDFKTMEVYSSVTYVAMALGVLHVIIEKFVLGSNILIYVLGAAIPAILIYIINRLTGGFGEGDIDAFIIIGLFLGIRLSGLTLFFSIIIGAAAAVILVITKKLNKKDAMPFVPYIFMALILVILCGEYIIKSYLNMFI